MNLLSRREVDSFLSMTITSSDFDDLLRAIGILGVARSHGMGCKGMFLRFSGSLGALVIDDRRTIRS